MTARSEFATAITGAVRYWEPRRIAYNLVLATAVTLWLVLTWPHFRPAFTLQGALLITILAALANVCYCAAYLIDVPLQFARFEAMWRRWRWSLWLAGMIFALLLANYWIADEIYPFLR